MKRKFIVIPLLFALIFTLTACKALQLNSEDVKVTEKPDSGSPTVGNKDEAGGEDTDQGTETDNGQKTDNSTQNSKVKQNSDLKDKGKVLQKDTEEYVKSIIEKRSKDVLTAIKNYDMKKVANYVHPDKGVRFSPYAYVDVKKDLVFTAKQVKNLASDTKIYHWGYYDGSGEPIQLKFSDYYQRFIYDVDFVNAPQVGYNKTLGHGNTINNAFEVYKNSIIVEYHFPGFDPQYEGMDWRSLRLVYQKKNNVWYLVGVIHDQWTS